MSHLGNTPGQLFQDNKAESLSQWMWRETGHRDITAACIEILSRIWKKTFKRFGDSAPKIRLQMPYFPIGYTSTACVHNSQPQLLRLRKPQHDVSLSHKSTWTNVSLMCNVCVALPSMVVLVSVCSSIFGTTLTVKVTSTDRACFATHRLRLL